MTQPSVQWGPAAWGTHVTWTWSEGESVGEMTASMHEMQQGDTCAVCSPRIPWPALVLFVALTGAACRVYSSWLPKSWTALY